MLMEREQPIREWAWESVSFLPDDWGAPLLREWQARARPRPVTVWHGRKVINWFEQTNQDGNAWLKNTIEEMTGGHFDLVGMSDSGIIDEAMKAAEYCMELYRLFSEETAAYDAMVRYAKARGVLKKPKGETLKIRIKRYTCSLYWRRQLRKVVARTTEHAAQKLGMVSRSKGCYASHVAVRRRKEQIERNDKILESIKVFTPEGEDGTCTNLKQIAEHTLANKTIRRGELMLRARGFEEVAADLGHVALFVTLTCPSRYHAQRIGENGQPEPNPNWDKSSPRDAQNYLNKTWSRIRAALGRRGRTLYGIRVAEPHHDGCPHWHMLVFAPELPDENSPLCLHDIIQIIYEYALADTPEEPGAWRRRVDFVRIQPDEGSAAGYIAKYLAKNLDGMHVEEDLLGNPALVAAQRVDAWAATWGIRQFQQLGGAPVGVWRELRRCKIEELNKLKQEAPEHLQRAIQATSNEKWLAQMGIESPGARASWAEYITAQGGPTIGRKAKITLWKEHQQGKGRYGDPLPERVVGVQTLGTTMERFGIIPQWPVVKQFFIKSIRRIWVTYKKFDIVSLMHYVSRIALSRYNQGIMQNEKSRKNQIEICPLPHNGKAGGGVRSGSRVGEGSGNDALLRHEQKQNPRRAYVGLLRLHCGAN